jgi:hypothetical protein
VSRFAVPELPDTEMVCIEADASAREHLDMDSYNEPFSYLGEPVGHEPEVLPRVGHCSSSISSTSARHGCDSTAYRASMSMTS